MTYTSYALLSAIAAAATAILAKVGVQDVPSNLATAIRTVVVLVFASGIVFATGEHKMVSKLTERSVVFLCLSGLATGISWLAYFRALQLGPVSSVAPIDKLSLGLTITLSAIFLQDVPSAKTALGVVLMMVGALLTLR